MSKTVFPRADAKTQWWYDDLGGSKMSPNVLVWHTTEGPGFPSSGVYRNGATAPNITVRINIASRTMSARQHFPADRSSRALENRSGGVQTNTANAFQVEVVGTCDPKYRKTWGRLVAGRDYLYLPDAPEWALALLAEIPRWLNEEWPNFPIKDAAPRGWKAYPDSYGNKNGQRLSGSEWSKVKGMLGHQHVPENSHGDPGNLDIASIVLLARCLPAEPAPSKPESPEDFLDPNLYPPGGPTTGPQITWLGKRLVVHLKALRLSSAYKVGPGPNWGDADRENVKAFQLAQGWTGADADGYPGPTTLARLEAAPSVSSPTPPPASPPANPKGSTMNVKVMFLPMAGYNADGAEGVTKWRRNTDGLVALVKKHAPDFIGTTELSARRQAPMLPQFDRILGTYSRDDSGSDGRYVYRRKATSNHIASGYVQAPKASLLNGDDKQAAWSVDKINGALVGIISAHLENQDGVDKRSGKDADDLRVDQMLGMVEKAVAKIKANGVEDERIIVVADTNSRSWVKDAMVKAGWIAVGPGHFTGWNDRSKGDTIHWGFVRPGAKGKASVVNHDYSDHTMMIITWTIPV